MNYGSVMKCWRIFCIFCAWLFFNLFFCCRRVPLSLKSTIKKKYAEEISPVHVVLVSLLVDQLFGLFLIFLVDQRKNCPVSGNFWSVSEFFVQPFFEKDWTKNSREWTKKSEQKRSETGQTFFGWPKKMRNRPNNWSTKRLTKTTWTGLLTKTTWTGL